MLGKRAAELIAGKLGIMYEARDYLLQLAMKLSCCLVLSAKEQVFHFVI